MIQYQVPPVFRCVGPKEEYLKMLAKILFAALREPEYIIPEWKEVE